MFPSVCVLTLLGLLRCEDSFLWLTPFCSTLSVPPPLWTVALPAADTLSSSPDHANLGEWHLGTFPKKVLAFSFSNLLLLSFVHFFIRSTFEFFKKNFKIIFPVNSKPKKKKERNFNSHDARGRGSKRSTSVHRRRHRKPQAMRSICHRWESDQPDTNDSSKVLRRAERGENRW